MNASQQQNLVTSSTKEEAFYSVECLLLRRVDDSKSTSTASSSSSSSSDDEEGDVNHNNNKNNDQNKNQIFCVRAWMSESQGFKVFSSSSSSSSSQQQATTNQQLLHQASNASSLSASSIKSAQQLAETATNILSSSNNNNHQHTRNVVWSSDSKSATVIFDPIDGAFTLAVRVLASSSSLVSATEVSEFAELALFVLTTDVPLDTIIPTGWLAGAASASGRRIPVSLRSLFSAKEESKNKKNKTTSAHHGNGNDTDKQKKSQDKFTKNFKNELKKRLEICCVWWLKSKRQEKFLHLVLSQQQQQPQSQVLLSMMIPTLSETTNAALKAANDPDWIEMLHFHLQSKFNLPFSVNVSPLMWSPSPSSQTSEDTQRDDDTRFFEDGWLMMQDKTVIGCTPVLDALKRRALQQCIALVCSSVDELVSHIGELCAAPSASGGGLRLARPVIPPVVMFDLDVTSWLDSMAVLDYNENQPTATSSSSNIQPFSIPTTSSHFQPTTTKLPGWQDTNAINNFVSNNKEGSKLTESLSSSSEPQKRHRVVVASSAGGAFAPKGFSAAFFLTASNVPFVGISLALARDVARSCLSDASSMWEQYTEERAARDNTPSPQLRQLFDANQVLLHAVMSCSYDEDGGSCSGRNIASSTSGDYLISGGSESAIRLLLGPPLQGSLDRTLEGSRKVSEVIAAAQKEIYFPKTVAGNNSIQTTTSSGKENKNSSTGTNTSIIVTGPFHEHVLRKLKNESGILTSLRSSSSSRNFVSSRRVLTLKHPFLEKNPHASSKDIEQNVTRRILAVVAAEEGGSARIAIFSVPTNNFTDTQAMHLGRLLPM